MKDKQISEEELFKDLDTMYQRVADVEKEEAEEAGEAAAAEETVEEEAAEEEAAEEEAAKAPPQKKGKPQLKKRQPPQSSRRPIIIASIGVVVVIFALAMTVFKPMVAKFIPGMGETSSVKVAPPPLQKVKPFTKPSVTPPANPPATSPVVPSDQTSTPVPIPKEQEAMKTPPKEQEGPKPVPKEQEPVKFAPKVVEKTTPLPQETAKLEKTFIQGNYYAIQVGAFQNFEYARDLVESLKKDGLDAYWLKKGTLYKVFVGQFANKNEAVQYLKGQKTLNNYPGSYPQKVSSPMASSTEIDPQ